MNTPPATILPRTLLLMHGMEATPDWWRPSLAPRQRLRFHGNPRDLGSRRLPRRPSRVSWCCREPVSLASPLR